MIALTAQIQNRLERIQQAADKASFRNFGHAAATIRKDAAGSIEQSPGSSEPGTPPHTHKRKFLSRAIRFAYDKDGAVIGPRFSVVGEAGEAHEFGGEFQGDIFEERAFMGPSLERNEDRFAAEWEGSIGE